MSGAGGVVVLCEVCVYASIRCVRCVWCVWCVCLHLLVAACDSDLPACRSDASSISFLSKAAHGIDVEQKG